MSSPLLTPPDAALARILEVLAPLPEEAVAVDAAVGRALGDDILARRTLPPWDNSAVDGYAVRAADAGSPGAALRVTQTVRAGTRPAQAVGRGEAARIMTGAPLPPGADAVVMQERAERLGDEVRLQEVPAAGQLVRRAGEDATAGSVLLPAGTVLGIPEAALLWAQGILEVQVPRRPTVAIVASGDELCLPEDAGGDRIVDTNSPQLALCVARAGGVPRLLGVAPDDPDALTALVEQALDADVVLTSAGVSVGDRDFVHEALRRLGVTVHFWRVAIKPGKPLLFGSRGRTAVFGLPGNPASSLVTFELFVRPALQRLVGHPAPGWRLVPGRCGATLRKPPGLTHYVRATAELRDGALWASPLSSQTSGAVRSVAGADCLLVLPAELERWEAGDPVSLLPVTWGA
jgi:molybdopterin molybdotransferase